MQTTTNLRPYKTTKKKTARDLLYSHYADKLTINQDLSRQLVSYQADKKIPLYRWMKYKEAFSSELVGFFLNRFGACNGKMPQILDPFAGTGTTLTATAQKGWKATGIELLPVGVAAMKARMKAAKINLVAFEKQIKRLEHFPLNSFISGFRFSHLRITEKAFPAAAEKAISAYMGFLNEIDDRDVRYLFWFACLSILEDISYTRKDGQYLRWDNRAARRLKSEFNKGDILGFRPAIIGKLNRMYEDIKNKNGGANSRNIRLIEGSCLKEIPRLQKSSFDLIMTSPPYCNRYDYTRTYALELAFIGYDEDALKQLRQTLLSATVENKSKRNILLKDYFANGRANTFTAALKVFNEQEALHEVLGILHRAKENDELNNNNIPDMVENYFFEINLVIRELSRVLAPGGRIVMVNDNVRYHGEEIPVDLILSDFAEKAGLFVEHIWVLPRGKGNSSQQMGIYGRNELRKGVYVWSKPK
ncbi:MAG: site-specific DNA-methyltransferase [Nitrospirota bacterium]